MSIRLPLSASVARSVALTVIAASAFTLSIGTPVRSFRYVE